MDGIGHLLYRRRIPEYPNWHIRNQPFVASTRNQTGDLLLVQDYRNLARNAH